MAAAAAGTAEPTTPAAPPHTPANDSPTAGAFDGGGGPSGRQRNASVHSVAYSEADSAVDEKQKSGFGPAKIAFGCGAVVVGAAAAARYAIRSDNVVVSGVVAIARYTWWLVCCAGCGVGGFAYARYDATRKQEAHYERQLQECRDKKRALGIAWEIGALTGAQFDALMAEIDKTEHAPQLNPVFGTELAQSSTDTPWMTHLMREMWPGIQKHVKENIIEGWLEKKLKNDLGEQVCFTSKELGSAWPRMGPMSSCEIVDRRGQGLTWRWNMTYESNCNICIRIGPVTVGIKNLEVSGVLAIRLRPMQDMMPFIGGMEVTFINRPKIAMVWQGLANVVGISGLNELVMGTVKEGFAASMVLPNRMAFKIDWTGQVDLCKMRVPEPQAILRVTVRSATDLPSADWALRAKDRTSDPYVRVHVGTQKEETGIVYKTLNPQWTSENVLDFRLDSVKQLVEFEVFDWDQMKSHDFIGAYKATASDLLQGAHMKEHTVRLDQGTEAERAEVTETKPPPPSRLKGYLTFTVQWIELCDARELAEKKNPNLQEGVHTVAAVPGELEIPGEAVVLRVQDESGASPRGGRGAYRLVQRARARTPMEAALGAVESSPLAVTGRAVEPEDPLPGRIKVHYVLPSPPHSALLMIRLLRITGARELEKPMWWQWKVTVDVAGGAKSVSKSMPLEQLSWCAWGPWDGYPPQVAEPVESKLRAQLALVQNFTFENDTGKASRHLKDAEIKQIAAECGITDILVKKYFIMYRQFMKLREEQEAQDLDTIDGMEAKEKLRKDADKLRGDWETAVAAERSDRRRSAEPQWEQTMYFLLPAQWWRITMHLVDSADTKKWAAGFRFYPSHQDIHNRPEDGDSFAGRPKAGCLSLGLAGDRADGSKGHYEVLDPDSEGGKCRKVKVGACIEGPFDLPNSMAGGKPGMLPKLEGSIEVLQLMPSVGSTEEVPAESLESHKLYPLFGPKLAPLYLARFVRGKHAGIEDIASLKVLSQRELNACFERTGVTEEEHRRVLAENIALYRVSRSIPGLRARALSVEVIRGFQLIAQDTTTSDPFVTVTYNGISRKIPMISSTLNPDWRKRHPGKNVVRFGLATPSDKVTLLCEDWDYFGPPDFMGRASFCPLAPEICGDPTRPHGEPVRVHLGADSGNPVEMEVYQRRPKLVHPLGELEIRVTFENLDDLAAIEGALKPGDPDEPFSRPWLLRKFEAIDTDHSNAITRAEILEYLEQDEELQKCLLGAEHSQPGGRGRLHPGTPEYSAFEKVYKQMDSDGDGRIGPLEFVSAIQAHGGIGATADDVSVATSSQTTPTPRRKLSARAFVAQSSASRSPTPHGTPAPRAPAR
eukprot:TRINITY_DN301_c1_g1_i1.p1 TRINITY_DN301_c1_g1~~TRINITY_DN301_c1_g1_i1.p1  ORF type:complete len:1370 (+),score=333.97 TRINITY_DN301_c1_g1_i1:86-4111(+)